MLNEALALAQTTGTAVASNGIRILDLTAGGILVILVLDRVLNWTIKWKGEKNGRARAQQATADAASNLEVNGNNPHPRIPCAFLAPNVLQRDKISRIEIACTTMADSMKDIATTQDLLQKNAEAQTGLMRAVVDAMTKD